MIDLKEIKARVAEMTPAQRKARVRAIMEQMAADDPTAAHSDDVHELIALGALSGVADFAEGEESGPLRAVPLPPGWEYLGHDADTVTLRNPKGQAVKAPNAVIRAFVLVMEAE